MADADAVASVRKRDELIAKLAEKEQAGKPIEPEEKRELMEFDEAVRTNALLAKAIKKQGFPCFFLLMGITNAWTIQ